MTGVDQLEEQDRAVLGYGRVADFVDCFASAAAAGCSPIPWPALGRAPGLYSLVQCAKVNGLEPYAYLRRVFTELPRAQSLGDIEALLPTRLTPADLI